MQKLFSNYIFKSLLISAGLVLLGSFQRPGDIVLTDEPLPFKPDGYYFAGTMDARENRSSLAHLIVKDASGKTTNQLTGMRNGVPEEIYRFITHNIAKDVSLRPVIITFNEVKLTETALPDGRVDGVIRLNLSFGLEKNYGTDLLVDYKGGMHYIRPATAAPNPEPQLRSSIKNSLVYFNNWMKANAGSNIKLANDVQIRIKDHTEQAEGDTVYYATNRPLTWADFQSKVPAVGSFAAAVMPAIAYDEQQQVSGGTIHINLTMKTYVAKSTCWASTYAHDDYYLNHEQRHFDIAKLIAERYKQKILKEPLSPETYEAFISMQYLEAYREMNTMQSAYDKETGHGRNHFEQSDWNNRIDKELKSFSAM